jgi:hypothetical protein
VKAALMQVIMQRLKAEEGLSEKAQSFAHGVGEARRLVLRDRVGREPHRTSPSLNPAPAKRGSAAAP